MARSDRISYEGDAERAVDAVANIATAQAWPGVFSGGKEIVRTEIRGKDYARFEFNDGSAMTIEGQFVISYEQPRLALVDDVVEGEYTEITPGTCPSPEGCDECPNPNRCAILREEVGL